MSDKLDSIYDVLKQDDRLVATDGSLLKNKVYEVLYNFKGKKDEDFYVAFSIFPILNFEEQVEAFTHSLENVKNHKKELEAMLNEMIINFPKMPINVTGLFIHPIKILETDEEFFEMVIDEIKKIRDNINHTDNKPIEMG